MAGTRDEEIGHVPINDRARLQDQIDCLRSERNRLRAQLNAMGGGDLEARIERCRCLADEWHKRANFLISAGMPKHSERVANMAQELTTALK